MADKITLGKTMNDARAEMNAQLKAVVVPHLRSLGFRGSLPHFRRLSDSGTELLTFQFSMSAPRFVVEAAFRAPYKVTAMWGDHIPPEKLTAHHVNERERIGKKILGRFDPWYEFGAGKDLEVCQQVIRALPEADDYWRKKREAQPPAQTTPGLRPVVSDLNRSAKHDGHRVVSNLYTESVAIPFKTRAGITFGLAIIYGCAGWWMSLRVPFVWFDYLFVAVGALGFFMLEPVCSRFSRAWMQRLNALGFLFTILFIVGLAVKLYIDVGS